MGNDYIMENESRTPQIGEMQVKGTQKILHMIFIVDTSGSMQAEHRIDAVNEAFTKMVPVLREVQLDVMSDFELKISILRFDQTAEWSVTPTPIQEYFPETIICNQWVTYYSEAFKKLDEKLTRSEYMAHEGKIAKPYIMFMTDGAPTQNDNYQPELDKLLKNGWFREAQRFAVLIGRDTINSPAARAAVEKFVSNTTEGIINAEDAVAIAREVQARTIQTVVNMTKHVVEGDSEKKNEGGEVIFV